MFYVYEYVREDLTPYYIGKGKDKRAWASHRRSNGAEIKPKDNSRIRIIKEGLTEKEAFDLETKLIKQYELKENGGLLVNMTYGGEGRTPGKELRDNLSKKLKGKKKPPRTDEHRRNQSLAQKGKPKPKVREGLKKWYASNPDRSESIAKQSASLKEWYKTADKDQKAWNTWHTRYKQDYDEYARAIKLLKQLPIFEVEKQVKFKRDTLRKLKNQNHGVFKHFPELSAQSS